MTSVCLSSDDGGDACGLAKSRSRREKREKVGRKSALEQLKRAKKGEKVKYEVRNRCSARMCVYVTNNIKLCMVYLPCKTQSVVFHNIGK